MRVVGLAGWSGAGKTTLLVRVLPVLVARGVRVSTVKHAHHTFDIDHPGKDSHKHRVAGATEVLISAGERWALMHELRGAPQPSLAQLLTILSPVDLVIVEGYKRDSHPKLEVYREVVGKPLQNPDDPDIFAVASDAAVPGARVPVISLADAEAIADVLLRHAVDVAHLPADPAFG
jgi:molybdopterin-guanine dinucleotide biosynthesis protein B